MTALTEKDLQVVGRIQEARGCTVAKAREIFRKYAKQLADPDHADRAQLVSDNFFRTEEFDPSADNPVKDSAEEQTKMAPEETKKKKARKKPAAKKKAAKPKTAAVPALALADLTREVELQPTEEKHVHTALLFGKKHAVSWSEIGHDKGAKSRFAPPHLSEVRLDAAIAYGKTNDLPVAVCVTIRVSGRLDQGYAIPSEVFKKFITKMSRGRMSLSMSNEARAAYREGGWDDVKFSVAKSEQAAAA